jgi:hypothetical protein
MKQRNDEKKEIAKPPNHQTHILCCPPLHRLGLQQSSLSCGDSISLDRMNPVTVDLLKQKESSHNEEEQDEEADGNQPRSIWSVLAEARLGVGVPSIHVL